MASFVLPLVSGLAGLFGGGKQKTVDTTSNTTGSSSGSTSGGGSTSTQSGFNLTPEQQSLADNFSKSANSQLNNATNLTPYTQGGLQQIGQQGNANASAINNNLASRGLTFSPNAGSALAQNTINTGNQQQQFLQGIPLLQNQLQTQAQQNAEAALKAPGIATTGSTVGNTYGSTTGTNQSSTNGTQTTNGDPLAGLFGGLGAGLAGGNQYGQSNITSILRSLGLA